MSCTSPKESPPGCITVVTTDQFVRLRDDKGYITLIATIRERYASQLAKVAIVKTEAVVATPYMQRNGHGYANRNSHGHSLGHNLGPSHGYGVRLSVPGGGAPRGRGGGSSRYIGTIGNNRIDSIRWASSSQAAPPNSIRHHRVPLFGGEGSSNSSTLFSKSLMSLLNKLTEANFDKVSTKIGICVRDAIDSSQGNDADSSRVDDSSHDADSSHVDDSSRVDDISLVLANAILAKCYQDHGFIHMYSNLFQFLVSRSGIIMRSVLDSFVSDSIASFHEEEYELPSVDQYDAFCVTTKRIHVAVGRNLTILNLIGLNLVSTSRRAYLSEIVGIFESNIPGRRAEVAIELIAGFAAQFARKNSRNEDSLGKQECDIMEGLVERFIEREDVTLKIRFKLMGLLDTIVSYRKR